MTITPLIGYPITHPTHTPKGHPNRPRIARPVSARIGPFNYYWSPFIHIVTYVTRGTATAWMPLHAEATR